MRLAVAVFVVHNLRSEESSHTGARAACVDLRGQRHIRVTPWHTFHVQIRHMDSFRRTRREAGEDEGWGAHWKAHFLLHLVKTLMSLFIEWCQQPPQANRSFVTGDTALMFANNLNKNPNSTRKPCNNVYGESTGCHVFQVCVCVCFLGRRKFSKQTFPRQDRVADCHTPARHDVLDKHALGERSSHEMLVSRHDVDSEWKERRTRVLDAESPVESGSRSLRTSSRSFSVPSIHSCT